MRHADALMDQMIVIRLICSCGNSSPRRMRNLTPRGQGLGYASRGSPETVKTCSSVEGPCPCASRMLRISRPGTHVDSFDLIPFGSFEPEKFLLRHFGAAPKCRAPCQFIKFETFAQLACFQCINTDSKASHAWRVTCISIC